MTREEQLVSRWIKTARSLLLQSENREHWISKFIIEERFLREKLKRNGKASIDSAITQIQSENNSEVPGSFNEAELESHLSSLLNRTELRDPVTGASNITREEARNLLLSSNEGQLLFLMYSLEAVRDFLQPTNSTLFTKVSGKFGLFVWFSLLFQLMF